MKKVLVILVTYNGMQWLSRCLGSVKDADIFVVDNDSTDGSADWIQGNYPDAKLVRSAENLGFSKANNLGFEFALKKGYEFVYLLNQDAWLEDGALDKLLESADSQPEYAVLSPLQMTDGYKELDRQFKKDKTPPAAHWLVRADAIRKVGLFNEDLFPFYGQDDDWCNRARFHCWKIGIVPDARGVHDRAQRKESKDRIIDRNYRIGSLVRLANPNVPMWLSYIYVLAFTFVKAIKYRSLKVFKYFFGINRQLSDLRRLH